MLSVDQNRDRDDENSAGVLSLMTSRLWQPLIWSSCPPHKHTSDLYSASDWWNQSFGDRPWPWYWFFVFFFLVSLSNSKENLNHLEVLIIPPGDSNLIHKSCLAVKKKKTTNIFFFLSQKRLWKEQEGRHWTPALIFGWLGFFPPASGLLDLCPPGIVGKGGGWLRRGAFFEGDGPGFSSNSQTEHPCPSSQTCKSPCSKITSN